MSAAESRVRRLVRAVLGAAAIVMAAPGLAADVARVLSASGVSIVERAGAAPRILGTADGLTAQDVIAVGPDSHAMLEFTDQTRVTLRPDTVFRIDSYRERAPESMLLGLVKGGLRAITGLFAKRNPGAVKFQVATTTIGIRGTEFDARLCDAACAAEERLQAAVNAGPHAARVVEITGTAAAAQPGEPARRLGLGAKVYEGDAIATGPDGRVVLAFVDRSAVALERDARFFIAAFQYDKPGWDGAALLLHFHGLARVETGLMAKAAPDSYVFISPLGEIRPRGTLFGSIVETASSTASDAADTARDAADSAPTPQEVLDNLMDDAENLADDAAEGLTETGEGLADAAREAKENAAETLEEIRDGARKAGKKVMRLAKTAWKKTGRLVSHTAKGAFRLAKGIARAGGRTTRYLVRMAGRSVRQTGEKADSALAAARSEARDAVPSDPPKPRPPGGEGGREPAENEPRVDTSVVLVWSGAIDVESEDEKRFRVYAGQAATEADGRTVLVAPDAFARLERSFERPAAGGANLTSPAREVTPPGVYVWVRDGAVTLEHDGKALNVAAGGAAVVTRNTVLPLESVPSFMLYDPTPRPIPAGAEFLLSALRAADGSVGLCVAR